MSLDHTDDKSTFRQWLGAVRQQAITWASVDLDLCHHIASLGRNELIHCESLHSSLGKFYVVVCSLKSTWIHFIHLQIQLSWSDYQHPRLAFAYDAYSSCSLLLATDIIWVDTQYNKKKKNNICHLQKICLILTHWGHGQNSWFFLQTTYSVTFSSMKMSQFCIKFLWNVLFGVQLMKFHHWLR